MKVWKKGVHDSPLDIYSNEEDPIKEKVIIWAPVYSTALGKYFSERSYGEKVNEVLYREFCLKSGYNDKLLYYGPRKKIVDCAIVLNYQSVLEMSNEEYGKYLAKLYIERSNQFTELKIKDFDVGKYVEDLTEFFKLNMLW
ncbi:MAG: hypothetical protein ABL876_05955 [Chitinophagaceae bacterium]